MPLSTFHIILSTTPLRPKPGDRVGYSPTPFFIEADTINSAVRKARGEAAERGLAATYVMCARAVTIPGGTTP